MELIKNTIDTRLTEEGRVDKGAFMKMAASANKDYESAFNPEDSKVIKVFTFNGQAIKEEDLICGDEEHSYFHKLVAKEKAEEEKKHKDLQINFYNLELIFEVMNLMAESGEIRWKYDYDAIIDKNATYILRINIKAFYDKLLKKCREHELEIPLEENRPFDFARTLKHKSYYLGSFNTRFLRQDNSGKKFINTSSVYLDVAMLQNMGVEIGEMLVDNRVFNSFSLG